jgi:hypothetical protein
VVEMLYVLVGYAYVASSPQREAWMEMVLAGQKAGHLGMAFEVLK